MNLWNRYYKLLIFWGLLQSVHAQETPVCPTSDCAASKQETIYTITPKRGCFEPYKGPLLGSVDQAAFDLAPIEATADQTHLVDEGESLLLGNADVKKLSREMESPRLLYQRPEEIITAKQGFRYQEPGLTVVGKEATHKMNERDLTANQVEYRIEQRHARGTALHLHRDADQNITLNTATYTTCAPGNRDWLLSANTVFLNPTTGWGEAHEAKLSTHGVPVAYTPYYRFPIDSRRHTGFLTPSFGYSRSSGSDIVLPFYWDLNPQYDLFLTPRFLSRNGYQLKSEFRYLHKRGKGKINAEFLPHDKSFQDRRNRTFVHYDNQTQWNRHWSFDWALNHVSDTRYFADLDDEFGLRDLSHLPQNVNLYYNAEYSNFLLRTQSFQTIDESIPKASRPFARLPEVAFNIGRREAVGLDWNLGTLFTHFQRSDRVSNGVDRTTRLDIAPNLRWPIEATYGLIEPSLTLKTTHYQLGEAPGNTPKRLSRTLPILSVDGRLFLEKDLTLFKRAYVQTLEPRLFYVFIPERDQTQIPSFDSSSPTFSYAQVFRENRFTGQDRVGDANQLGMGLSSRFLSAPGLAQKASVGVGQTVYFGDRRVRLSAAEDNTRRLSNLFAEASYGLSDYWSITDTLEWNTLQQQRIENNVLSFQFQKGHWRLLNVGYHYRGAPTGEPAQHQLDTGLVWPITSQWLGLARMYYDLNRKQPIDSFVGFEYNSCCWAIRFVAQRRLDQQSTPDKAVFDHRFYMQFVLKGLGTIGQKTDSFVRKGIPNYSPPTQLDFHYGYE